MSCTNASRNRSVRAPHSTVQRGCRRARVSAESVIRHLLPHDERCRPIRISDAGDTAHGRKPDPGGLQAIISNAGATPAQTLLVGDSPVDRATARNAGTGICLARYGFGYRFDGSEFDGTEHFVDEAAAIVELMEQLDVQT